MLQPFRKSCASGYSCEKKPAAWAVGLGKKTAVRNSVSRFSFRQPYLRLDFSNHCGLAPLICLLCCTLGSNSCSHRFFSFSVSFICTLLCLVGLVGCRVSSRLRAFSSLQLLMCLLVSSSGVLAQPTSAIEPIIRLEARNLFMKYPRFWN